MRKGILIGGVVTLVCVAMPVIAFAQSDQTGDANSTAAELQDEINQHNDQIAQLNQQIAQYQTQLNTTSAEKQTLQTQVDQLQLSIKKSDASISVTQNEIGATKLELQQLSEGIAGDQTSIASSSAGLAQSIRSMNEEEAQPFAIEIFSSENATQIWNDIESAASLSSALGANITQLASQQQSLTNTQTQTQQKQEQLEQQQATLETQQGSLNAQQQSETQLLEATKSQESTYEQIIAQKQAQSTSLQEALSDLKSQYNEAVNPSEVTPASPGVLQWPISGQIIITQYFGDTPFAQANPTVYSGHGHDGLDIGVPIGTPVHAALTGTVLATGDTDLVHDADGDQCYSFGKWIMLKHDNGLNTMYAHLSEIDVTPGQSVTTGEVIGYSGETGYATGPHLHFGVYVSSVTQIIQLGVATEAATPCATAVMPVPPLAGYLNPLDYLPTTNYIDDTGD